MKNKTEIKALKKRVPGRPKKITTGKQSYLNQIKDQAKEIKYLKNEIDLLTREYNGKVIEVDSQAEIIRDLEKEVISNSNLYNEKVDEVILHESTKEKLLIAEKRLDAIDNIATSLTLIHQILEGMNKAKLGQGAPINDCQNAAKNFEEVKVEYDRIPKPSWVMRLLNKK